MSFAKNPNFYTVGIPFLFLYRIDDWTDPKRVDWAALWRAYSGVCDPSTGEVLNANSISTCLKPNEILERAYVGNLVSAEVAGDVKTVEHTVSVLGRKEIDKVVLIRKAVDYNISFDEMDKHLKNFLISKDVSYPDRLPIIAKNTFRIPQTDVSDFIEGPIELIFNGLAKVGTDCADLEYALTKHLRDQGTYFGPFNEGGTDYFLKGIYYFLVADKEREPVIDSSLEPYRGRIVCGYFEYDDTEQMMKLRPFPSGLDNPSFLYQGHPMSYSYVDTTIHDNVKMLITKADSPNGIATNSIVSDRSILEPTTDNYDWNVDAADTSTHSKLLNLKPNIMRDTFSITITAKTWDGTAWVTTTETLRDGAIASTSTNTQGALVLPDGSVSKILDSSASYINWDTGDLNLVLSSTLVADMQDATNGIASQQITFTLNYMTSDAYKAMWTGLVWAKESDLFTSSRVVRPKLEIEGTALIVFKNNVGVSFVHVLPRVVFKPDGTIDFAKDDWEKGSFVISVIRDEDAFIPFLPSRVKIPFGFINTFRIYERE